MIKENNFLALMIAIFGCPALLLAGACGYEVKITCTKEIKN